MHCQTGISAIWILIWDHRIEGVGQSLVKCANLCMSGFREFVWWCLDHVTVNGSLYLSHRMCDAQGGKTSYARRIPYWVHRSICCVLRTCLIVSINGVYRLPIVQEARVGSASLEL